VIKKNAPFIVILILVIAGFGIGIYLQDQKHQESTRAAWEANRSNFARFNKIRNHAIKMDTTNWQYMRDSIWQEVDSFMILRFRKEMDSLQKVTQKD
jgi:hypothetical protein